MLSLFNRISIPGIFRTSSLFSRVSTAQHLHKGDPLQEDSLLDELGIEGFQLKYEEIRAADGSKYYYDEIELNRLGYRLINKGKLDQAILVFEANVELFPEAPNVYDSLGEAS